ncbi:MAG: hypothetical protein M3015_17425 [Bacteroidota bacterium]|nr:hypothetical protein [Bacteroidota bacterium]
MENIYSAYVRTVNGDAFYFVKKYQVFPEYKDIPPILDSYAMHTDFEKACKIAMICDKIVKEQLISELQLNNAITNVNQTRPAKARIYKINPRQIHLPSMFKLGWLTKIS